LDKIFRKVKSKDHSELNQKNSKIQRQEEQTTQSVLAFIGIGIGLLILNELMKK